MNLVVQDKAQSIPACHNKMKSENSFFAVHHVKLPQHSWRFWRIFLVLTGEKVKCLTPAEDWHIFHIKTDAYLFSCTKIANWALQNSKLPLSKITQTSETENVKISVTNGWKSFENTQPLQSNGLNSPFSAKRKQIKKEKRQLAHWVSWFQPRTRLLYAQKKAYATFYANFECCWATLKS